MTALKEKSVRLNIEYLGINTFSTLFYVKSGQQIGGPENEDRGSELYRSDYHVLSDPQPSVGCPESG